MVQAEWLEWAIDLQKKMDKLFWDDKGGAYFSVDGNDETLVLRLKEDYDGAEPSYVSKVLVWHVSRAHKVAEFFRCF